MNLKAKTNLKVKPVKPVRIKSAGKLKGFLKDERAGVKEYKDFAAQNKAIPAVKRTFTKMSRDEGRHAGNIEKLIEKEGEG